MAQDTWTDENLVKLKAGFDAGLSCAQIAMGIKGITRNAVIGKLNRLGLRRIYQAPRQPVERKAKPFREKKFKRSPAVRKLLARVEEAVADVPIEGVSLLDLTDETCRYPIGDVGEPGFCFCGRQPHEGFPYCAGHARIAYTLPHRCIKSGPGRRGAA